MGVLSNKLGIQALSLEDPAQPLLPYSALFESLGLGRSDAGVMVNEKQAMRITTAFACIMIVSADLSSLPLPVLQRMPDGSVREAPEHRLYPLIHDYPNSTMTSMVYRGAVLASALGWGNSYSLIRRDGANRVIEIVPLPSDRTSPVLINGKLMYATTATVDGQVSYIKPEDVLHISGLSFDGFVGMSPIQTCKNAFGLALAAEKMGAQLFGNGAKASGVLSHPNQLGTEAYDNLKKSIREIITGDNALRPLILEEGMKWEQITVNPTDAQFLETRKFQREEIAALYRVPMHLLQSLDRATNNNIEHQSLDYIRYCLRPWAVRIEQEINRKLLSGSFFVEHDFNAFQRGDYQSQVQGMMQLRLGGVYNANDVLRQLRQNPISADEGGDVRFAPLNMVPLKQLAREAAGDGAAAQDQEPSTDSDQGETITDVRRGRIANAYRRLFRDAVGRVANRKSYDETFAYRAFQPVIFSAAETLLSMYFTPSKELLEEAETEANALARAVAVDAKNWTAAEASAIATRVADETTAALYRALIEKGN
jgi:HK97 family phage portal protein